MLALEDAGWGGRPLLGEMGKLLALQAVVSRRRGELRLFGPISRMDGFLEQLSAAISELRAYRHRPEGLAAVAELLKDEGPVADKLHDLALLYKDYDAFVARQFHDPETTLDLASDVLAASSLVKGAEVWVDGFAGFTPQEYGVLEALFTACRRVTVALCLDPFELGGDMDAWTEGGPGDHFHPTRETLVALRDRARSLGVPIEPPRIFGGGIPPRFRGSPVLAELERVVSRGWRARRSRKRREAGAPVRQAAGAEATAGAPVPAVEVIEAPDPRAEVEAAAAAEITRLVREQGMRYSDVAVITRDVGPYKELIEAVFARWRIPYFLDAKDPAFHHPLITFVRACLDTAAHGLDTERVIRYLKTDLAPVSRVEADLLEMKRSAWGSRGRSGSIRGSGLSAGAAGPGPSWTPARSPASAGAPESPWPDSSSGYGNCRGRRAKAAAERRSAATWSSSGSSWRSAARKKRWRPGSTRRRPGTRPWSSRSTARSGKGSSASSTSWRRCWARRR